MPRGAPDYNQPDYNIASVQFDDGVLLTALAGIAPLDGLGRIVSFDNFRDGFNDWDRAQSQATGLPVLTSSVARVSPVSVLLYGSAGVNASTCYIRKVVNNTVSSRIGLEFSVLSNQADVYLYVDQQAYTDTFRYNAQIRIQPLNFTVELRTMAGYVQVATLPQGIGTSPWVTIKLVSDLSTGKYVRLMVGDTKIDLSSSIYQIGAGSAQRGVLYQFENSDDNKHQENVYIGHVIITMDEP